MRLSVDEHLLESSLGIEPSDASDYLPRSP